MASRKELQKLLESLPGGAKVYYNPPESAKMTYPAIVFQRERIDNTYASNNVYVQQNFYQIVVIDRVVDSPVADAVSKLPTCRFVRHYRADNLLHDIFTINF